jgi:hypothetical protein
MRRFVRWMPLTRLVPIRFLPNLTRVHPGHAVKVDSLLRKESSPEELVCASRWLQSSSAADAEQLLPGWLQGLWASAGEYDLSFFGRIIVTLRRLEGRQTTSSAVFVPSVALRGDYVVARGHSADYWFR